MAQTYINRSTAPVALDVLMQLTTITWDGDLISKFHRDKLVEAGYVLRINGWNIITENGIIVLANLGALHV